MPTDLKPAIELVFVITGNRSFDHKLGYQQDALHHVHEENA